MWWSISLYQTIENASSRLARVYGGFIVNVSNEHALLGCLSMYLIQVKAHFFPATSYYRFIGSTLWNSHVIEAQHDSSFWWLTIAAELWVFPLAAHWLLCRCAYFLVPSTQNRSGALSSIYVTLWMYMNLWTKFTAKGWHSAGGLSSPHLAS